MLLHRRQDAQVALDSLRVVIVDVLLNHLGQLTLTGEPPAIIALPFQDTPESLHRAVINAVGDTGHALRHSGLHKLLMKRSVGILKASVAVKQGMCVRIGLNRLVEGIENQRIVVALAELIGYDAPVTKIQNGTQIELVHFSSLIPLEFCYIREPLLVGLCGMKLTIQQVFSNMLRVFLLPGTATVVVLHGRAYVSDPADAQHPLVIDVDAVVMAQVIIEPAVAFIRALPVELLNPVR